MVSTLEQVESKVERRAQPAEIRPSTPLNLSSLTHTDVFVAFYHSVDHEPDRDRQEAKTVARSPIRSQQDRQNYCFDFDIVIPYCLFSRSNKLRGPYVHETALELQSG